jgi:16S rRNA G527 N7-methylase RsmG
MARQGGLKFDLVLVRAVGRIDQLLPELAAVTRPGGSIVLYKTDQADTEVATAEPIASKLRLTMEMYSVELPAGAERLTRKLVRCRKTR